MASNLTYESDTLFNETQTKSTNLLNQGLWCPSDKTPDQQNKKSGNNAKLKPPTKKDDISQDKNKKALPFANTDGKLGDTKEWNGTTYYYCSTNHKYSH